MDTLNKPFQNQKPVLTGEEANPIDLKQASEWTRNYRERYPDEVISYFFGINIIKEIIHQEGCVGLRIYYANSKPLNSFQKFILLISNFLRNTIANAEGEKHLIVVGSDKYGNDQLPGDDSNVGNEQSARLTRDEKNSKNVVYSSGSQVQYVIAEQASPCPGPGCPKNALSES